MHEYECKRTLECKRCGDCCRFRPPKSFSDKEDHDIRQAMYEKTGIIYIYPLERFTISITSKEKETMERKAEELNIKLVIRPKKLMIKDGKIAVLDWFLDHEHCPFLKDDNVCQIYEDRPLICKVFPRSQYTKEEEQELILMKGDILMDFDSAVETVLQTIKQNP